MEPTVKLVSCTEDPIETTYVIWEASRKRHLEPHINREYLKRCRDEAKCRKLKLGGCKDKMADLGDEVNRLFLQIIRDGVPVAENINFTFLLDHVSIALREQLVRHRVGVKVGPSLGVDMVPDLGDSTWWSQSMRILDMGAFADDEAFLLPEVVARDPLARATYVNSMAESQQAYKELLRAGIPMEDARNVIPLAATHRISWTLNLAALQHIVGKRGCWILQLGLWGPVIKGMIEELATTIDPCFRELITPPCLKGDKFVGCHFIEDNERRIDGKDKLPPCSLYLQHHKSGVLMKPHWEGAEYERMMNEYSQLWQRDPITGVRHA